MPLPRRPGAGAKEQIDLSSLFAIDGLLGDSDSNLIPDRLDAVVSPAGEGTEGVVDLAARLGLESTGLSWPLVIPPDASRATREPADLVLVGTSHPLAAELAKSGKLHAATLQPGQGLIQVSARRSARRRRHRDRRRRGRRAPRAAADVGTVSACLGSGARTARRSMTVEDDVRRFIGGRSPAGQAATAMYKLDQLAARLRGRALESAQVRVHVEKAADGLDAVIRKQMQAALTTRSTRGHGRESRRAEGQARSINEEDIEIASEVDEFWQALRTDVIPTHRGRRQPVVVEARLSEPPEIRERIAREATDAVDQGRRAPDGTSVVVLSAYKQGYSWLYDVVRPALAGKPIETSPSGSPRSGRRRNGSSRRCSRRRAGCSSSSRSTRCWRAS